MKPHLSTYRYGTKRKRGEGLRIGATRQVPRGIKSEDWQKKGYFDLWMPLLSPSVELLKKYLHQKLSYQVFARRYQVEMKRRESRQVVELLAAVSLVQPISFGCFCQDESRCHRRVLHALVLSEAKRRVTGLSKLHQVGPGQERSRYASPVCFADEAE
jgi:uncharacterized protein YeaO (DUF488 family)